MATDLPVILLDEPIDIPEQDGVTQIRFLRKMTGRDLVEVGFGMNLSGGSMFLSAEQVNQLTSKCTGIPVRFIENLPAEIWTELFKVINGFFSRPRPQSGGNDSQP